MASRYGSTAADRSILEGIIVAGGGSRDQVEQILADIVPSEKRELAYIFQLRKRKPSS